MEEETDWSQISRSDQRSYINAGPHVSGAVLEILEKYGWQVLPHLPYSLDMSPPAFDLFPKLKKPPCGKRFRSIEEVSNEVTRVIRRINNEGVLTGIQDLPKHATTVYIELGVCRHTTSLIHTSLCILYSCNKNL